MCGIAIYTAHMSLGNAPPMLSTISGGFFEGIIQCDREDKKR